MSSTPEVRQTPWGERPTDWCLVPWREFAKRAGRSVVVDGKAAIKQVTVRVRHQGVVERRHNPNRQREILTPNQTQVRDGQFVISKIDARNGACGFIPSHLDGAVVTSDFPVYDISPLADRRYLDHVDATSVFWRLCESVSDGSTNRVRLNLDLFDSLEFPLPLPGEQRAIAGVLDAIDEAIERTEAVIAATETLRKALLEELLTRGVPGWHTEWKQVPGIGTAPADWDARRLGQVAAVQTGRALGHRSPEEADQEVPYVTVANVKDGYVDLRGVREMRVRPDEIARYRLRVGDVLFTEGRDADKLGRGTVWRGEIDLCLHQNHIFAVRPEAETLLAGFLALYAASRAGKRYFLGAAKQTTNLATLNSTQLRLLPLPLPDLPEQAVVVRTADVLPEATTQLRQELRFLQRLKAAAAGALLTGRIRVPVNRAMGPMEDANGSSNCC